MKKKLGTMDKIRIREYKHLETVLVIVGIWALFVIFNHFVPTFRSDDLVYTERLEKFGYWGATIDHYLHWSSRLIIEWVLMVLTSHFKLWKLLNSLVMTSTVLLLTYFGFGKLEGKKILRKLQ